MPETVLVTGAAGFIGYHLSLRLLADGARVVGFDNLNPYYPVELKRARLAGLRQRPGFSFVEGDLADARTLESVFETHQPSAVVNLAAQAGVRYSLEAPREYTRSNVEGFLNVLEACRATPVRHLVYASSSSVYGNNARFPFSVADGADHPVSLYAATKKANEAMAHSYSHLFGIPTTGLRFFTVYGPWGRPDMAYYSFTKSIFEGRPIQVFNEGQMRRDFTYVDDIVEGVARVLAQPPTANPTDDGSHPGRSAAPYRVYNIGNQHPVQLGRFIEVLEDAIGKKAEKRYLPMQPGDVVATGADIADLEEATGFRPSTPLEVGIPRFVAWYREFHGV